MTEFPVSVVNLKTKEEVARFHRYVCPTVVPSEQMASYIAKKYEPWGLASKYDNAKNFKETIEDFEVFLVQHGLVDPTTKSKMGAWTFLTCGNWDLKTMLPSQALTSQIEVPQYMQEWINIKEIYCHFYNHKITGMMVRAFLSTTFNFHLISLNPHNQAMLTALLIEPQGHHHSGIDDVLNIISILRAMIVDGCRFQRTAMYENGKLLVGAPYLDSLL